MTDGLGDFFGGGGGGAPGISFDSEKPGANWGGILVPSDLSEPDVAYRTTQQSSVDGDPLFWEAKPGQEPQPRKQAEITVLTEFRKYEFMSDAAVTRKQEAEEADDGVRRQFIKGSKKNPGASAAEFGNALRAAGVTKPEVGAYVTQKLVKRVPLDGGKKANYVEWTYKRPTPETLAKVKAYLEAKAAADSADGDEDPPF